ncbi:MAG: Signal transduction histidine kinase containing PAS domain [Candidatus Methanohalarchaeum thermophilum]|uniref:histidine kinase n=1 Tax=Methanohalarchaeum thermophilum TaxID=1903181 RepID=A0A1Q6DUJ3_METT1|nr:MAG: Signal transduction histidine kinase containing PAS domain [Candidatus Methanohalarchaeum thermophilum]
MNRDFVEPIFGSLRPNIGLLNGLDKVFVYRLFLFVGGFSYLFFGGLYIVYEIKDPMPIIQRILGSFFFLFPLLTSFFSSYLEKNIDDVIYFVTILAFTHLVYMAYISNYAFNYSLSIIIVLVIINLILGNNLRLKIINIYFYILITISVVITKTLLYSLFYLFVLLFLGLGSYLVSRFKSKIRRKYKKLFLDSPIGLVEASSEGQILRINQEMLDILKINFHEDPRECNIFQLLEINPKECDNGERVIEVNGDRIWIKFRINQLKTSPLNKNKYIISCLDISERKEAEKQQNFLHSILRHDLKNKIQILEGYHDLLMEKGLNEKTKNYLKKSEKVIEEITGLIKKVKTLKKATKKEETKAIEVGEIIGKSVKERKPQANEKNIEITQEKIDCKIKGGKLLKELFNNLIENAIKHSKCKKIKISSKTKNEKCIITIEDDGKGIPDKLKQKVFRRSFKHGETSETGLGLYIVREIARAYGGKVKVKDSKLGGARFDVYLKKA